MRKLLGIGAFLLGVVGTLVSIAGIGLGWWAASWSVEKVDRVAVRVDQGLSDADGRIARVETRVDTARKELNDAHKAAAVLAASKWELPRVRAEIDRQLDRLTPTLDRVTGITEALRFAAEGLRNAAEFAEQLHRDSESIARVRSAADTLVSAADALDELRGRADAVKSAKATDWTRDLLALTQEAIAQSDRLAAGLTATRRELTNFRSQVTEIRDSIVSRIRIAAIVNTLFWVWVGLGQLCVIGWGRRRIVEPAPTPV